MASLDDIFKPFATKKYHGFSKLAKGYYEIKRFKFVKNPYQKADNPESPPRILAVELADQILFLPAYFALNFKDSDELLAAVNEDKHTRFLYFGGKKEK